MASFKQLCGFLSVHDVIDCMQIHILKPKNVFTIVNYFSYKSKSWSLQLQVMVDHQRWFQNVFVGMLNFMNDSQSL
jgi:hypothetical protein